MKTEPVLDVAELPTHAFGHRSALWWGTLGFVAIEGLGIGIAIVTYLYLRTIEDAWPPPPVAPPGLLFPSLTMVLFLVSWLPNHLTKKAAEREELGRVRLWLVVTALFETGILVTRAFEFTTLNVRWDSNAYGSAVWVLLGLHTTHLLADYGETLVLLAMMLAGPITGRRFVDVYENADFWNFVVIGWVPVWFTLYLLPRLI